MTYAIRFDFPDLGPPYYAGMHKGGLGWAPTLKTALLYDDIDVATRMLTNGYGNLAVHGRVIVVRDGQAVARKR